MLGNAVAHRYVINDVDLSDANHSSSSEISVLISSGGLNVNDVVCVSPTSQIAGDAANEGLSVTGRVIDATHIGIIITNPTSNTPSSGTASFNVLVFPTSGETSQTVSA